MGKKRFRAPVFRARHLLFIASDGETAPRGLSFLLEPNRLNVAISRAQCLSIVVGSPSLTTGIANTLQEAEQINRLCRITQPAALLLP